MEASVTKRVVVDVHSYAGLVNVYNHIKSLIIEEDSDLYNVAPVVLFGADVRIGITVDLDYNYRVSNTSTSYGEYVVQNINNQIRNVGVCIVSFRMPVNARQYAGMLFVIFKLDADYWRIYESYEDDPPILMLEKWDYFVDDITTLLNMENNEDRTMLWNSISNDDIPNNRYARTIEVFIDYASM